MKVTGIGTAGTVPNLLYLPDLQAHLFSQKQAMGEGAIILLSSDGQVFTVTTASDLKWNDMIPQSVSPALVSPT